MFVDSVTLTLASGKGGAGAVAFRREKFVVQGGPEGGDGGRGGDLFFEVDKNSHTLANFKGQKIIRAKNGHPGGSRNKYGKSGEAAVVVVPPGTQVYDVETGELLLDLTEIGEKVKFLEGGKGGLGNSHFKSSTNQRPTYAQPGLLGEEREVRLELKMIADVGLVGFPNVGKSTLISTVSNARPEIADYEFTTLTPKLGVVTVNEYESFVMADIPGIIEGASEGKGLGLQFLKHIERTKTLLFVLDVAHGLSLHDQYQTLKVELAHFSPALSQRVFAIALSRIDAYWGENLEEDIKNFLQELGLPMSEKSQFGFNDSWSFFEQDVENFNSQLPCVVYPISSVAHQNIEPLKFTLHTLVSKLS